VGAAREVGVCRLYEMASAHLTHIDLELPEDLARLRLPEGVDRRLQWLLDKQGSGEPLSEDERLETECLVDLSETLTLLRLRASARHVPQD